MCIFCATIPVTLAVGAKLNAEQNDSHKSAELMRQVDQHKKRSVGPLTILAVTGLVISSVIYHTHFGFW
jgi:hypothetical protein